MNDTYRCGRCGSGLPAERESVCGACGLDLTADFDGRGPVVSGEGPEKAFLYFPEPDSAVDEFFRAG